MVFYDKNYLHWLKALGILGSVSESITTMLKLGDLLQVYDYLNSENISTSNQVPPHRIKEGTRPSTEFKMRRDSFDTSDKQLKAAPFKYTVQASPLALSKVSRGHITELRNQIGF